MKPVLAASLLLTTASAVAVPQPSALPLAARNAHHSTITSSSIPTTTSASPTTSTSPAIIIVGLYGQCGYLNQPFPPGAVCAEGLVCTELDIYYSQCLLPSSVVVKRSATPTPTPYVQHVYGQCGGPEFLIQYPQGVVCAPGSTCVYENPYFSNCFPVVSSVVSSTGATATATKN